MVRPEIRRGGRTPDYPKASREIAQREKMVRPERFELPT
jgi:hypothetical protein